MWFIDQLKISYLLLKDQGLPGNAERSGKKLYLRYYLPVLMAGSLIYSLNWEFDGYKVMLVITVLEFIGGLLGACIGMYVLRRFLNKYALAGSVSYAESGFPYALVILPLINALYGFTGFLSPLMGSLLLLPFVVLFFWLMHRALKGLMIHEDMGTLRQEDTTRLIWQIILSLVAVNLLMDQAENIISGLVV